VKPDAIAHKVSVIEKWAEKEGRDTSNLVVSNELARRDVETAQALYDAGVRLFTLGISGPHYDHDIVQHWVNWRDAQNG
jgi:hypothetical protein